MIADIVVGSVEVTAVVEGGSVEVRAAAVVDVSVEAIVVADVAGAVEVRVIIVVGG